MDIQDRTIFNDIVMSRLQVQRQTGKHCDVRLSVGKHYTWTHSSVMCSLSPFISRECCNTGKLPAIGDYKEFSCNSPLTIKLYKKYVFDCFNCLQVLVDIIYGQKIDFDPLHSPHLYALCKLLSLSEVLINFICNQISINGDLSITKKKNSLPNQNNLNVGKSNSDVVSNNEKPSICVSSNRHMDLAEKKVNQHKSKMINIRSRTVLPDLKMLSGKKHSCIGCSYKCYKPCDLLAHLRETGHGDNVCSLCLSEYDSHEDLKEHYSLHDNPKPFFCTFCDVRFQTRGLLSQHLPRHSKETPYTCSFCQKGFKWKHGLNSHLMIHSNEKKYLCDECGFSTVHGKTMRAHKLIHTGDLFRCTYTGCTHTCSRKENMKFHLLTHSNDKPFVCEICGQKFSLNKSLKRHALIHSTAGLTHTCPQCPFKALRADNLKAHILRQHRKHLDIDFEDNYNEILIEPDIDMENSQTEDFKDEDENDLSVLADAASSRSKIEDVEPKEDLDIYPAKNLDSKIINVKNYNTPLIITVPNNMT